MDKNNPTATPPMEIYCDQCEEVATGYFDVYTGEFTWTEDCARCTITKEEIGFSAVSQCKLCEADPSRKPPRNEVMEYFAEQYAKAKFRVVPGHWPDFQTKEEVDEWLAVLGAVGKTMEEAFDDQA